MFAGIEMCSSIVQLEMAGCLQDTSYPCIVTKLAGRPVTGLSNVQCVAAKKALKALHAVGAAHGDISSPICCSAWMALAT